MCQRLSPNVNVLVPVTERQCAKLTTPVCADAAGRVQGFDPLQSVHRAESYGAAVSYERGTPVTRTPPPEAAVGIPFSGFELWGVWFRFSGFDGVRVRWLEFGAGNLI